MTKKTSSIWIQLFLFKLPPKRKHLVLAAFPAASLWVPGRGLKTVAIILAGKHILKQQFLPSMHKSSSTRESKKLLENALRRLSRNRIGLLSGFVDVYECVCLKMEGFTLQLRP